MKPLNIDETIVLDEEKRRILFLDDSSKSDFEIPHNQQWDLFLCLVAAEGTECDTVWLEEKLDAYNPSGKSSDSPIKYLATKLRNDLINIGIPCNKGDEKDPNKITIGNKRNRGIRENTGSYTLILPKIKNKTEKVIADLYWNRYESVSAQKEGEHKNEEVIGKIGDVYQFPLILDDGYECQWNISNSDTYNNNVLIEAPNGYGKTTFMRSIILSATFIYRNVLSGDEKNKYERISKFHGVDNSYLCIYIECKNIDININDRNIGAEWLYKILSGIRSLRIDKYIDQEAFVNLIKEYNLRGKLILLFDGFDELNIDDRPELIEMLSDFQHDKDFGCNSKTVITTRPLFWGNDFNGYKKYTISNRNIIEKKSTFLQYVQCYSHSFRPIEAEQLYEYVMNNYYLKNIACTPAIIVWIIKEYGSQGAFYESMERIIEQIMLRYKSGEFRELTVYKEQYKRVYEEIAYDYLRLTEKSDGLLYFEAEMLSMIRGCIERIKLEGNKRFNRVFNNKQDDELGELFFTNVALLDYVNSRIKFSNSIFAYHLAARRVLRSYNKKNQLSIYDQLDLLSYKYRYYVIVIAASLALHLTDNRFFEAYGNEADEIRFEVADDFINYISNRWNEPTCTDKEKTYIQEATAHILLRYYGENVYTNRNMLNDKCISLMEDIIKTELNECGISLLPHRTHSTLFL